MPTPERPDLAKEWRENYRSVLSDYMAMERDLDETLQALDDLFVDRLSAETQATLEWSKTVRASETMTPEKHAAFIAERWKFGPGVTRDSVVTAFDYEDVVWLLGEVERIGDELQLALEIREAARPVEALESVAAFSEASLGSKLSPSSGAYALAETDGGDVLVYHVKSGKVLGATKKLEEPSSV